MKIEKQKRTIEEEREMLNAIIENAEKYLDKHIDDIDEEKKKQAIANARRAAMDLNVLNGRF